MSTRQAEEAYTITEAAELKRVSPNYIRRAVRATEGNVLAAKNIGTAGHPRYRILASELDAWFDRLGDA